MTRSTPAARFIAVALIAIGCGSKPQKVIGPSSEPTTQSEAPRPNSTQQRASDTQQGPAGAKPGSGAGESGSAPGPSAGKNVDIASLHPRSTSEIRLLGADDKAAPDLIVSRGTRRFTREGVGSGISITLRNEFIEQYKNKVTIDATYTIDAASKVHPPKDDGEIHIAGRAPEIQLPTVAEIMQAKSEKGPIAKVNALAGTDETISVTGAWRIWCEHAGGGAQVQGAPLEQFDTSNPDHVFEIHPVTKFGDASLLSTFVPTPGYEPKEAENAFMAYEQVPSTISVDKDTTTVVTRAVGNNFVDFILQVSGEPLDVDDGRFLIASALSADGDLVVRNRRMVFVKGTKPYGDVSGLKIGDCLHVIGIPRVDLALVSWRARHAQDRPEALNWTLPYEIIVVASKGKVACEK